MKYVVKGFVNQNCEFPKKRRRASHKSNLIEFQTGVLGILSEKAILALCCQVFVKTWNLILSGIEARIWHCKCAYNWAHRLNVQMTKSGRSTLKFQFSNVQIREIICQNIGSGGYVPFKGVGVSSESPT